MKKSLSNLLFSISLFFLGISSIYGGYFPISPWIIDPQHCLSHREHNQLEHHLIQLEKSSGVYVNVILLNQKSQTPIQESVDDYIKLWEAKFPEKRQHTKLGYIVINLANQDAKIILGNAAQSTAKINNAQRIQEQVLANAMLQNGYEQAIKEGSLALRIALEDQENAENAASYFGLSLWQWILMFAVLLGIIYTLKTTFWPRQIKSV